jgi:hypothetical protein
MWIPGVGVALFIALYPGVLAFARGAGSYKVHTSLPVGARSAGEGQNTRVARRTGLLRGNFDNTGFA